MRTLLISSICLLALVLVMLYVLMPRKSHDVKPQPQPQPQPWSGDQLNRSVDLLRELSQGQLPDNLLHCCVHELSMVLSFPEFVAKNEDDKHKLLQAVLAKCQQMPPFEPGPVIINQ